MSGGKIRFLFVGEFVIRRIENLNQSDIYGFRKIVYRFFKLFALGNKFIVIILTRYRIAKSFLIVRQCGVKSFNSRNFATIPISHARRRNRCGCVHNLFGFKAIIVNLIDIPTENVFVCGDFGKS